MKRFRFDDTALGSVDVTLVLVSALGLVFVIGFPFFIPFVLTTESSLVPLVSAMSPFFSLVSIIGVGKRALDLRVVTIGTGRREGRHQEGVVQDGGSNGLETLISNSDGKETADDSGEVMGLNKGWMS